MSQSHPSFPGIPAWLVFAAVGLATACGCEQKREPPVTTSTEWLEFDGSWNGAGTRRSIPLGPDRKASAIDLRGTMLLAGAGRPSVGFGAEIVALVDSQTGLVGRGVWTDEHGDQVFSELKGEGTREHNHIAGTIIGGTGRYAGLTGSYEFSWQFVLETDDGAMQGRTEGLRGRCRIGPTAPARSEAGGAKP